MKTKPGEIKWHLLIIVVIIVSMMPIVFAVSNSFKTLSEAYADSFDLIPDHPTVDNYLHVLKGLPFLKITLNTFLIAGAVTVFKTITSFLTAYAFVYYDFKGKTILYFVLISTMFIPFTVTMIPNYLTVSALGLRDSIFGVILPQLSDALGVFLLRQSMKTIPRPLVEAVYLENAGDFRLMKDLVVPLVSPAIISTGIIFFINSWNEYVWPVLILKSEENYTLSLALQTFISAEGGTQFTVAMAISVLTMLPPLVLYLIFQRFIINTFAMSGIKG
jgi:sn-glycerol 3-phosphate transport system permease protein